MKNIALIAALAALSVASLSAAPTAPKWLVLDKITYQSGVDRTAFDGIRAHCVGAAELHANLKRFQHRMSGANLYETHFG